MKVEDKIRTLAMMWGVTSLTDEQRELGVALLTDDISSQEMMAEESVRPKSRKGRMEPRIGLDGNIDRFFVNNPVGVDPVECQQSAVAAGYIDSTVSVPEIQRLFTKKPHKYTKLPGTNKYILKRLLIAKGNGNHPEGHPDTI